MAFSTLEALFALVIAIGGVMISVAVFRSIEKSSARTQDAIRLINLESSLQVAIEDVKNYIAHRPIFNSGVGQIPPVIEFKHFKGADARHLATFEQGRNTRLFFNKDLNVCNGVTVATKECPFSTAVSLVWNSVTSQYIVTGEVSRHQVDSSSPINSQLESFVVPSGYFQETSLLKCASVPGKTFIGIQSYNLALGTTQCWELKNSSCPQGQYPQGLKVDSTSITPMFELDCTSFYKYECPSSYAPKTFFPINPEQDTDPNTKTNSSCINLKKKNISSPRVSHFLKSIDYAQNVALKFGLRWMSGRVCPAGYEPKARDGSNASFETALRDSISVGDALLQATADCSTNPVKALCTKFYLDAASDPFKDEPAYACDLCPYSTPPADGCSSRNFPHPYDTGAPVMNPTCSNPNIVGLNTVFLKTNFDCVLLESELSDGI